MWRAIESIEDWVGRYVLGWREPYDPQTFNVRDLRRMSPEGLTKIPAGSGTEKRLGKDVLCELDRRTSIGQSLAKWAAIVISIVVACAAVAQCARSYPPDEPMIVHGLHLGIDQHLPPIGRRPGKSFNCPTVSLVAA
jgi:hypothetical protein